MISNADGGARLRPVFAPESTKTNNMRQAFFSRSLRFEMKIARLLAALRASYRAMRVVARFARHRGSLLISRGSLLGSLLSFMVR